MISLYDAAITIIVVVLFLAPVSIWIMLKYFDMDRYRDRQRRIQRKIFQHDRDNDPFDEYPG